MKAEPEMEKLGLVKLGLSWDLSPQDRGVEEEPASSHLISSLRLSR